MAKLMLKSAVMLVGLGIFLSGLYGFMNNGNHVTNVMCIIVPCVLFCWACNAGKLDDLLDYIEGIESKMLD